jgi:hypothetical protein
MCENTFESRHDGLELGVFDVPVFFHDGEGTSCSVKKNA